MYVFQSVVLKKACRMNLNPSNTANGMEQVTKLYVVMAKLKGMKSVIVVSLKIVAMELTVIQLLI